jgi:O-antigen/teichoic acid export membrane protein
MSVPRKSIAYNGMFAFFDKAYTALSSLLLVPFLVHSLGMEVYGTWIVLTTVASYFALGNCGVIFSYEKYIAHYGAKDEIDSLRRFIATAFYGSLALGLGIFLVSLIFSPIVFRFLLKNDSLGGNATIFILLMIYVSLSLGSTIITSVPKGMQRYDFASVISIFARTLYIVAVVVLCIRGMGLMSIVIGQYIYLIVTTGLSFAVAKRFFMGLSLDFAFFDYSMFKMMLMFGLKMQVSLLSVLITQSFDKLVIAYFLGVRLVAVYDIGSRLIIFLKDVPSFLFASITPRTSELHAREDRKKLQMLYLRGTKYLSIVCLGLIPLLFPVADTILSLWMHRTIDPFSVYVFQVLLFSTMFNATTGLGTSIGIGIGRPGSIAYSNIVMALVNIAGSLTLYYAFGPKGLVWGTAAGLVVSTVFYYLLLNRDMHIPEREFWVSVLLFPLIANALAVLFLAAIRGVVQELPLLGLTGALRAYVAIGINSIVALVVSGGIYALARFITLKEVTPYLPFLKRDR